jgi:hypothetical protein
LAFLLGILLGARRGRISNLRPGLQIAQEATRKFLVAAAALAAAGIWISVQEMRTWAQAGEFSSLPVLQIPTRLEVFRFKLALHRENRQGILR